MSHKFGFPAMTHRASNGNNLKSPKKTQKPNVYRVVDIVMDENHPRVKSGEFKWPSCMGLAICVGTAPINFGKEITALPINTNSKNFPVVNECVDITRGTIPNSNGTQYFYDKPIALYGGTATNGNFFPSTTQTITPPSQNLDYTQVGNGAVNIISNQLQQIQTSSPDNPSQATFTEKSDIHPLMPFEGDILREGRFGNSLRFGSTSKSNSIFANNWSTSGDNGNPITILRNGQPDDASKTPGYLPIVEDINKDLSSIYLTSTQKIPFSLANENFVSYTTPPTTPAQYSNSQVILNSNRIILNAKSDSVLISGQKSVGLSSNGSINLESTSEINITSKLVHLGNKNANQSVLRGDETIEYLKILINELQNIAEALKVTQDWPGGTPVPNPVILTTANSALQVFNNVYNQIDSVKSKIVKTI
jgi:hypothetical protein